MLQKVSEDQKKQLNDLEEELKQAQTQEEKARLKHKILITKEIIEHSEAPIDFYHWCSGKPDIPIVNSAVTSVNDFMEWGKASCLQGYNNSDYFFMRSLYGFSYNFYDFFTLPESRLGLGLTFIPAAGRTVSKLSMKAGQQIFHISFKQSLKESALSQMAFLRDHLKATITKTQMPLYNVQWGGPNFGSKAIEKLAKGVQCGERLVRQIIRRQPVNIRNKNLAGKVHEKTGIRFSLRGFPILDKVAVADLKIGKKFYKSDKRRIPHMEEASRQLYLKIQQGKIDGSKFTPKQMEAIREGEAKIPGFTWHHHENRGRMQLVPKEIHEAIAHTGGMQTWF